MWGWLLVLVLYAVGMGLFHVLGGIRAAGEAIENWGRASSAGRAQQASPSSS
jgi:hypothetical protein